MKSINVSGNEGVLARKTFSRRRSFDASGNVVVSVDASKQIFSEEGILPFRFSNVVAASSRTIVGLPSESTHGNIVDENFWDGSFG